MCPDIEAYAPLVAAAFGMGDRRRRSPRPPAAGAAGRPGADPDQPAARRRRPAARPRRRPRRGQPRARPAGRATPSAAASASPRPTSRRSRAGCEQAGVRWAFDAAAPRRRSGCSGYVQNTWRFGLDRVLAGVAMSDDAERCFGTTLPLDDVGSTSIDLAGRLAECVDRLRRSPTGSTGSHPVDHWLEALQRRASTSSPRSRAATSGSPAQLRRELAGLPSTPRPARARRCGCPTSAR